MRKLVAFTSVGLMLASGLAAPVVAGPTSVNFWVELYYGQPSDGPANPPPKVVTREMSATSVQAVEAVCAHSLVRLGRYVQARDISLQRYLSGVGGKCVTDASGKIKMTVSSSVTGSK